MRESDWNFLMQDARRTAQVQKRRVKVRAVPYFDGEATPPISFGTGEYSYVIVCGRSSCSVCGGQ